MHHEAAGSAPSQWHSTAEECSPLQVHLSLGKDPTHMYLSWKTVGGNCPSEVFYGHAENDGTLDMTSASSSIGYSFLLSERDMCSSRAAHSTFELYLHRAELLDLVPGKRYSYRVAGSDRSFSVSAARPTGDKRRLTFAAFGDMGESKHAAAKSPGAAGTVAALRDELDSLDLVVHVGDISYANGLPEIWDTFMDSIEPIAARVPYMVAIGNHEYDYTGGVDNDPSGARASYHPGWGNFGDDSGGECGVMTARRFHMPRKNPTHNPPFWYSFTYGSVQFIAISTEHDITPGSRQHQWLQAELESVDRCTTPWLVVLLHRPMYVVYPHKSNREVADHLRSSLEPLLAQHRVDLTLAGHVHSYYRTCAVFDEKCVESRERSALGASLNSSQRGSLTHSELPQRQLRQQQQRQQEQQPEQRGHGAHHGIRHFVIGTGGHKLSDVSEGQEAWVAADAQRWGYSRFTVEAGEQLVAEFVSSESGRVLDRLVLEGPAVDGRCPSK